MNENPPPNPRLDRDSTKALTTLVRYIQQCSPDTLRLLSSRRTGNTLELPRIKTELSKSLSDLETLVCFGSEEAAAVLNDTAIRIGSYLHLRGFGEGQEPDEEGEANTTADSCTPDKMVAWRDVECAYTRLVDHPWMVDQLKDDSLLRYSGILSSSSLGMFAPADPDTGDRTSFRSAESDPFDPGSEFVMLAVSGPVNELGPDQDYPPTGLDIVLHEMLCQRMTLLERTSIRKAAGRSLRWSFPATYPTKAHNDELLARVKEVGIGRFYFGMPRRHSTAPQEREFVLGLLVDLVDQDFARYSTVGGHPVDRLGHPIDKLFPPIATGAELPDRIEELRREIQDEQAKDPRIPLLESLSQPRPKRSSFAVRHWAGLAINRLELRLLDESFAEAIAPFRLLPTSLRRKTSSLEGSSESYLTGDEVAKLSDCLSKLRTNLRRWRERSRDRFEQYPWPEFIADKAYRTNSPRTYRSVIREMLAGHLKSIFKNLEKAERSNGAAERPDDP